MTQPSSPCLLWRTGLPLGRPITDWCSCLRDVHESPVNCIRYSAFSAKHPRRYLVGYPVWLTHLRTSLTPHKRCRDIQIGAVYSLLHYTTIFSFTKYFSRHFSIALTNSHYFSSSLTLRFALDSVLILAFKCSLALLVNSCIACRLGLFSTRMVFGLQSSSF